MLFKNIILTGFMGTGKTTVGRLLADDLGYQFIDTDKMIISRANMTIAEIFETKGESAFRNMEREAALELAKQERLVISTGGGMLLDSVNVDILEGNNNKGRIFCLTAPPEIIIERVINDNSIERPLLKVDNPKERIIELLNERQKCYSKFIQIDTANITPNRVCEIIKRKILFGITT